MKILKKFLNIIMLCIIGLNTTLIHAEIIWSDAESKIAPSSTINDVDKYISIKKELVEDSNKINWTIKYNHTNKKWWGMKLFLYLPSEIKPDFNITKTSNEWTETLSSTKDYNFSGSGYHYRYDFNKDENNRYYFEKEWKNTIEYTGNKEQLTEWTNWKNNGSFSTVLIDVIPGISTRSYTYKFTTVVDDNCDPDAVTLIAGMTTTFGKWPYFLGYGPHDTDEDGWIDIKEKRYVTDINDHKNYPSSTICQDYNFEFINTKIPGRDTDPGISIPNDGILDKNCITRLVYKYDIGNNTKEITSDDILKLIKAKLKPKEKLSGSLLPKDARDLNITGNEKELVNNPDNKLGYSIYETYPIKKKHIYTKNNRIIEILDLVSSKDGKSSKIVFDKYSTDHNTINMSGTLTQENKDGVIDPQFKSSKEVLIAGNKKHGTKDIIISKAAKDTAVIWQLYAKHYNIFELLDDKGGIDLNNGTNLIEVVVIGVDINKPIINKSATNKILIDKPLDSQLSLTDVKTLIANIKDKKLVVNDNNSKYEDIVKEFEILLDNKVVNIDELLNNINSNNKQHGTIKLNITAQDLAGNVTSETLNYQYIKDLIEKDNDINSVPDGFSTITFKASEGGSIENNKTYFVKNNTDISIVLPKVTTNTNYNFINWTNNDNEIEVIDNTILINTNQDLIYTANFKAIPLIVITDNLEKPNDNYVKYEFHIKDEDRQSAKITSGNTSYYILKSTDVEITLPEVEVYGVENWYWIYPGNEEKSVIVNINKDTVETLYVKKKQIIIPSPIDIPNNNTTNNIKFNKPVNNTKWNKPTVNKLLISNSTILDIPDKPNIPEIKEEKQNIKENIENKENKNKSKLDNIISSKPENKNNTWSLINLLLTISIILISIIAIFKKNNKVNLVNKILLGIISIIFILLFIFTENIYAKMVLVNKSTIIVLIMTIVSLFISTNGIINTDKR